MTAIAGLGLRSIADDIMRRGVFPGGHGVEVGEEVITIGGKGVRINRNVTQEYVFIRSLFRGIGVEAYLESHLGRSSSESGHSFFDYNVAIVAALVRSRDMAYITIHFAIVDDVVLYAIFTPLNVGVAIQTRRHRLAVIAVSILGSIAMEIGDAVAIEAVHSGPFPVNASRNPFV